MLPPDVQLWGISEVQSAAQFTCTTPTPLYARVVYADSPSSEPHRHHCVPDLLAPGSHWQITSRENIQQLEGRHRREKRRGGRTHNVGQICLFAGPEGGAVSVLPVWRAQWCHEVSVFTSSFSWAYFGLKTLTDAYFTWVPELDISVHEDAEQESRVALMPNTDLSLRAHTRPWKKTTRTFPSCSEKLLAHSHKSLLDMVSLSPRPPEVLLPFEQHTNAWLRIWEREERVITRIIRQGDWREGYRFGEKSFVKAWCWRRRAKRECIYLRYGKDTEVRDVLE